MTWSRRWTLVAAALAGLFLLAPCVLLAGIDTGLFDRAVEAVASAKARRAVRFSRLRTHLLSNRPWVSAEGLWIASPPAISGEPLLRASRVTAQLRFAPLLLGRFEPVEMTLVKPQLHLVRLRPGVTNFTFGRGGPPGFLQSMQRLTITDGVVALDDVQRQTTLRGVFSQQDRPGDPAPFRLAGGGVVKGGAYTVMARGADLNGRRAIAPYPFSADVHDGRTAVELSGTSGRPFDFQALNLAARASGPNLAALGYLFGFHGPNSPPFQLIGHVSRSGPRVEVSGISGRLGRSDVRGELSSGRRSNRATLTRVRLASRVAYLGDVRALLRARPPHALARGVSGASAPSAGKRSDGAFSSTPFRTGGMPKGDLQIEFTAAQVADAPLPVRRLAARVTQSGDRLTIGPVSFDTSPGRADLSARLDFASTTPSLTLRGALRGARLAALSHGLGRTVDGDFDAAFALRGQGRSPRVMAASASGRAAFRLSHGQIQRAKAAALSSDPVQAVETTLGGKSERTPLYCAVGEFAASDGRLQTARLDILTGAGLISGSGDIDIANGTLSLVLTGAPTGKALRVSTPVALNGPLSHPTVTLAAASGARGRGVGRVLSVVKRSVASMIARPVSQSLPSCATLLAEAWSYVGR
ncbi:MAG TPA: AsmA-like C-terminal region-containing protein [Caulobacteraceae bacterium]|nr:AsmA-like C-terminal region-containing protein [Caulobacteraceae bacterium]